MKTSGERVRTGPRLAYSGRRRGECGYISRVKISYYKYLGDYIECVKMGKIYGLHNFLLEILIFQPSLVDVRLYSALVKFNFLDVCV